MADEKEPERWDAPNQQAVGQPPPWEEGTGGSEASETAQEDADGPETSEQDPKAKRTGKKG